MSKKQYSYSEALKELEALIDKIENGESDVDELSDMVKKATELIKRCKEKLRNTEADLNRFLNTPDTE